MTSRGRRWVWTGVTMAAILVVAAPIAITSLLRSSCPPIEGTVVRINEMRTIISAELQYQEANQGWYDTLDCLSRPAQCIPGYSGRPFLDEHFAAKDQGRYMVEFHPGVAASAERVSAAGASPSSMADFAVVAVPQDRRPKGFSGVCGDSTGIICVTPTGGRPPVVRGQCVVTTGPPRPWLASLPLPEREACYTLQ
jgi:hypothetical protein